MVFLTTLPLLPWYLFKRIERADKQAARKDMVELHRTLEELRREVQALRETTTKFDMAFDASLSRLEERVDRIEERSAATRAATEAPAATVHRG